MSNSELRRRRANRRQIIALLVTAVALACGLFWYAKHVENSSLVSVYFTRADGSTTEARFLELAETREEQAKGLMYRTHENFPEDRGMLFLYRELGPKTFWMKNTYIALDMLFLGADNTLVGFLENVPPHTLESRSVSSPSRYVIEFRAGEVKRLKLSVGDRAHFSREDL
jgi:uncharacterized membrane protein (UPF0127 family)